MLLKLLVSDHDNLFVLAEIAHFSGIGFLLYKLMHVESCEGASSNTPATRVPPPGPSCPPARTVVAHAPARTRVSQASR